MSVIITLPSKRLEHDFNTETTDLEDALLKCEKAVRTWSEALPLRQGCRVLFLEDIIEELVGEIEDATRR